MTSPPELDLIQFSAGKCLVFDDKLEAIEAAERLGRGALELGSFSIVPITPEGMRRGLHYTGNVAYRRSEQVGYERRDTTAEYYFDPRPIRDWTLGADANGNVVIAVGDPNSTGPGSTYPPKAVLGSQQGGAELQWIDLPPEAAHTLFHAGRASGGIPTPLNTIVDPADIKTDPNRPTDQTTSNKQAFANAVNEVAESSPLFNSLLMDEANRKAVLEKIYPLTTTATQAWYPTRADRRATQKREINDALTRTEWAVAAALLTATGGGFAAGATVVGQNDGPVAAGPWALAALTFLSGATRAATAARETGRRIALTDWKTTARRSFRPQKRGNTNSQGR